MGLGAVEGGELIEYSGLRAISGIDKGLHLKKIDLKIPYTRTYEGNISSTGSFFGMTFSWMSFQPSLKLPRLHLRLLAR
jgi:hypothetical protein